MEETGQAQAVLVCAVEVVHPGSGWVDVHPAAFDAAGSRRLRLRSGPADGVRGLCAAPQDIHDLAQLDALESVEDGPA